MRNFTPPLLLENGGLAEWRIFNKGGYRVTSPTGPANPVTPALWDIFLRTDLDPEKGGRWFVYNGSEWVERLP